MHLEADPRLQQLLGLGVSESAMKNQQTTRHQTAKISENGNRKFDLLRSALEPQLRSTHYSAGKAPKAIGV